MKNWREETQPELPQVALDARDVPVTGEDGGGAAADVADVADAEGGGVAAGVGDAEGGGATDGAAGVGGASRALRAGSARNPWSVVEPPIPVFPRDRVPDPAHDPDEVGFHNDAGPARIRPTGPTRPIWPALAVGSATSGALGAPEGVAAPDVLALAPAPTPASVDVSERRRRRLRRLRGLGTAVGLACAVYAVVIVVTLLSGSPDVPWLPVPGQNADRPADKVDDSPRPARPPRSSDDGSSVAGPVVTDGTTPSAGASSRAHGPGRKGAAQPSVSARTTPPAGVKDAGSTPDPGSPTADTSPSTSPPDGTASPSASPSTAPSESATPTGGPVPGTVAEGPPTAHPPLAAEQPPTGPGLAAAAL